MGLGCLLLSLAACTLSGTGPVFWMPVPTQTNTPTQVNDTPTYTRVPPSATALPATPSPVLIETATPTPSQTRVELRGDDWQKLPVIPVQISQRVRDVYLSGLALGNQARIFTRIGDCASAAPEFLVGFDTGYNLGDYASLQPAIDYFKGSFSRPSLAAKAGLNSAGLLSTLWTDKQCQPKETLLDCQYRLDQPSFAFIAIGTNEAYYIHEDPGSFERNMRLILEDTIDRGIVPVLATKADDVEGDGSINATIASLAEEYELPLWNFWRAVQPLPNHGLIQPEHLSTVSYANFTDFTIPHSLEYGMQVRNLTALEMLDFLRKQLGGGD